MANLPISIRPKRPYSSLAPTCRVPAVRWLQGTASSAGMQDSPDQQVTLRSIPATAAEADTCLVGEACSESEHGREPLDGPAWR